MTPQHKPISRTVAYAEAHLHYYTRLFRELWPKRHTDTEYMGPHAHFRMELREASRSIRFWRQRLAERLAEQPQGVQP